MDDLSKRRDRELREAEAAGRRAGQRADRGIRPSGDSGGVVLAIIGVCLLGYSVFHFSLHGDDAMGQVVGGAICLALGVGTIIKGHRLPKIQIMRLAEARGGLLTLSEITTALDIEPEIATRTLKALSKAGIAHQRWQEIRKNLWEFPDYIKLPIDESIELAKSNGGRVSVKDLVARGQSIETARQTLDALSQSGLAQPDPAGPTAVVMLQSE